jgi:hypothetical protein
MTDAERKAINEELRYGDTASIESVAKILFRYGFVVVRHGMPKQDYYE